MEKQSEKSTDPQIKAILFYTARQLKHPVWGKTGRPAVILNAKLHCKNPEFSFWTFPRSFFLRKEKGTFRNTLNTEPA